MAAVWHDAELPAMGDPTAGPSRARSFGQPRGSASLNAAADGFKPFGAKPELAASACSPAPPEPARGCCLETLAHASLALGMMSPPAHGGAALSRGPTEETACAADYRPALKPSRQRSQPFVSLRSLPAGQVTKHPGVKNALQVAALAQCLCSLAAALPAATAVAAHVGASVRRR
jgi:hypothetical protein